MFIHILDIFWDWVWLPSFGNTEAQRVHGVMDPQPPQTPATTCYLFEYYLGTGGVEDSTTVEDSVPIRFLKLQLPENREFRKEETRHEYLVSTADITEAAARVCSVTSSAYHPPTSTITQTIMSHLKEPHDLVAVKGHGERFLTEVGVHRLFSLLRTGARLSREEKLLDLQQWIAATLDDLKLQSATLHVRPLTFQEAPRLDNIYIMKEAAELVSDVHKIGRSVNPERRERTFNTGSAHGVRCMYKRATVNAKVIEDIVRVVMKRYHVGSFGGTEHYWNEMQHSIDVIDVATTVVDTLASTYESMKRKDLLDVLVKRLSCLARTETDSKQPVHNRTPATQQHPQQQQKHHPPRQIEIETQSTQTTQTTQRSLTTHSKREDHTSLFQKFACGSSNSSSSQ